MSNTTIVASVRSLALGCKGFVKVYENGKYLFSETSKITRIFTKDAQFDANELKCNIISQTV